eukprot:2677678-Alexandrium_andersonii.AAC.1
MPAHTHIDARAHADMHIRTSHAARAVFLPEAHSQVLSQTYGPTRPLRARTGICARRHICAA